MFKSVKYMGFENQPELLAKAEGLLPTLDAELDTRLGPIHVEWHYVAPAQIELSLLDEVIGEAEVGRFDPAEADRNPRFFPAFFRIPGIPVYPERKRRKKDRDKTQ